MLLNPKITCLGLFALASALGWPAADRSVVHGVQYGRHHPQSYSEKQRQMFTTPSVHRKYPALAGCLALIALYSVVTIPYILQRRVVENPDYWWHLSVGQSQSWSTPETFVHGFYPLGYPALLHSAVVHGIDGVRFGQLLSWLGGLLLIVSVFGLALLLTKNWVLAFVGGVLLATNPALLTLACREGNDMPAAGLQLAGVYAVALVRARPANAAHRLALLAGAVFGLAYLTRYTALLLVPCALLYLAAQHEFSPKQRAGMIGLLLGGFIVVAAVQLIPSLRLYGTPFYNVQAKNIWFGIYGEQDWVKNWNSVPNNIGFWNVVALDPGRFLRHWGAEALRAVTTLRFWPLVLHVAWLLGFGLLVFTKRYTPADRVLLASLLLAPVIVTATAWLAPRFLLVTIAVQALLIVVCFDVVSGRLHRTSIKRLLWVAPLIVAAGVPPYAALSSWLREPAPRQAEDINTLLRAAGMKDPSEVVTNNFYLHATDLPEHTPYARISTYVASAPTLDELLNLSQGSPWRYLVLTTTQPSDDYAALTGAALEAKSRFVPLAVNDAYAVFCFVPCSDSSVSGR